MRLTRRLLHGLKDWNPQHWKDQWRHEARFFEKPLQVPPALAEKGVKIEDAEEMFLKKVERWQPPVPDDPRWIKEVPLWKQHDWKDDPAFVFDGQTQLYEGMKQACIIAKAQHFEGLPEEVQKHMGVLETPNRDLQLQRYIMLSQVWNTDMTKLKKRLAPEHRFAYRFPRTHNIGISPEKSSQIMMRNLLRMCKSHSSSVPSLEKRRHLFDPMYQSYIMYRDKAIIQRESVDCLVTSNSELPPFASTETVDESASYKVPDIWPVMPTVDFEESNNYDILSSTGFSKDFSNCAPHTIIQIQREFNWDQRRYDWSDSQYQASQLMSCLMYTASLARQKFGSEVKVLPEPISIQHVSLFPTHFLLTYFQLNTLDLDTDIGVKNLVWTGERSQFFEIVRADPWTEGITKFEHLKEFHGDAFDPFLATYLSGCADLKKSV